MEHSKPPRVFVSYSWESEDHKSWVRYLGERLYAAGIEARLDQWFVQPGESFTAFMEQEVEAADFVLVVCTPSYARKSNKRQGGVGYEQQIVSGQLMSGTARSKFIPILRKGDYEPGPDFAIPTHFLGIAWIEFRDDEAFDKSLEDLIRVIFSKPRFAPPSLGARPSLETITATIRNRIRITEADESIEKGNNVKTDLKPAPAASSAEFETVTLDNHGKEVDRRKLRAEYFTEDLDGVALEMVKVPSGTFEMGSPTDRLPYSRADRESEEPQHSVTVPEFFMGRYEVTREQWRQVAKMPRVKIDLNEDPSKFKDSLKQPVEQVSWEEAVEFCERLKKKTGKPYRLPSEAEWEYAARAGTKTTFAFGPTITPEIVNYDGNYPYHLVPKGTYRQKTVEVGSLGVANAFGLYDMHGNVWEWCEDVWHNNYKGAPSDGSAWLSGGDPTRRVLRGGSWYYYGRRCRSANRLRSGAGTRSLDHGFRVVVAARTR